MPRRRRRKKSKPSVSLFPFLSILACVIGTLTLMIAALALGQMDTKDVASAERLEDAKQRLEALGREIDQLKEGIAEAQSGADETQQQIASLRHEAARLKRDEDRLVAEINRPVDIKAPTVDEQAHKKAMEDLLAELKRLQEMIKKLQSQLAERKKPPDEARVLIRPGGSGVDLDPTFVECAAGSIVIYDGDKQIRVRRGVLKTDKTWLNLLDRISKKPKASVVFLVRDDGLGTYRDARNVAQSRYARNGKLPVVGHGKIDLSIFQKK